MIWLLAREHDIRAALGWCPTSPADIESDSAKHLLCARAMVPRVHLAFANDPRHYRGNCVISGHLAAVKARCAAAPYRRCAARRPRATPGATACFSDKTSTIQG